MTRFEELISKKTVEELMEYIDDFDRYASGALTAVIKELKAKGKSFSEEELKSLYDRIEKKREIEEEEDSVFDFGLSKLQNKYVVTDPNALLLYSKTAIASFSIFFTVIFGAVLLAKNIDNKTNKIKVIGVGLLFTILAILLGNLFSQTLYVYLINGIGGYVLSVEFWNKYIGRETKYRAKSIWIPLIISIIISVPFLIAMIYE
ncbi:MAG: hypothetical protein LBI15_02390 [Dysgonamonadaceae bacterium]|jgi:hypothetical protein|nr:hypothetical protein [Dysgonamonadaceae bacterium]